MRFNSGRTRTGMGYQSPVSLGGMVAPFQVPLSPALTFGGGGGSARIQVTAATSTQNITQATMAVWVNIAATGTAQAFYGKAQTSFAWVFNITGGGSLQMGNADGLVAITALSNMPNWAVGRWMFFATVWNVTSGVAGDQKLYSGTRTHNAAVATAYGLQQAGPGTASSDAGNDIKIGNNYDNTQALNGPMSFFTFYPRILNLTEIITLQWRPWVIPGAILTLYPAINKTGVQYDWSGRGNPGTVTSATLAQGPPVNALAA